MVTTFYPPYHFGGDAMHVYRLSNALARRGHHVSVVHSVDAYRALAQDPHAGPFPHEDGVDIHAVESDRATLGPLYTYLSGRPARRTRSTLAALFERERFDVVHFHNVSLVGGPGVLRYGEGVKLYTMHEHWLVCPMHVLWQYNRRPCERPSWLSCTLSYRRPPQLWRYTGQLERELDAVDVFLSPSRFTAAKHRERGFTREIRHLPYFLGEGEVWPPPERAELTDRPYFLFVGRLEKLKGVQTLIELFRHYDAAELVIAGDGTYGDQLRRLASGVGHVRFLGRVHPNALAGLYANAIALLIPSVGFEVFGIVALEAFAQRTPVLVRDLGALPEVVEDSGGGFVFRSDEELLEAMERLRLNASLRDELGQRGHDAWLRRWSEEPHLNSYFDEIRAARAGRIAAV